MHKEELFNPLNNTSLVSLNNEFTELINLHENNKLPRTLLFSGKKGIGKFTLANHLVNYVFSKGSQYSYDVKKNKINPNSLIFKQINDGIFQNLIILTSLTKIENIRDLKTILSKSTIIDGPRFVIIDDVELFNLNSMNALLKILEEPSGLNFFILIDNQTNKLLETISSRCLKLNIYLNSEKLLKVTNYIKEYYNQELIIENSNNILTPGNLIRLNKICIDNNISDDLNILSKSQKLLSLFKLNKDPNNLKLLNFFIESYFYILCKKDKINIEIYNNEKNKVLYSINDFVKYNLNINSTLNTLKIIFSND
jgi:DNA polymerase III subunit delta'